MRDLEKEQLFSNLLYALFNGWVLFSYKKANGNEHIGIGTLNTNIIVNNIGYEFKTANKFPYDRKTEICKYYDILYLGWRSFHIERIDAVFECNLSDEKLLAYVLRLHYGGLNLEASDKELIDAVKKATGKTNYIIEMCINAYHDGVYNAEPLKQVDLYNLSQQISKETYCNIHLCNESRRSVYEDIFAGNDELPARVVALEKISYINKQIAELIKEQQFLIIKLQQDEKD